MKRILLKQMQNEWNAQNFLFKNNETEQSMCDFVSELRLLKNVPFSYLIPDEKLLPPESIRFFYLDENWLDALTDGATSIGRISTTDAFWDRMNFEAVVGHSVEKLSHPRFKAMHPNHRRNATPTPISHALRTGFILRSELVRKWKGLEVYGYHGDTSLEILRMETIANNILLCIFDGELDRFVVSEPKTGLRFGTNNSKGEITLKNINDNDDFGKPLEDPETGKINLNEFRENNGRIKVAQLSAQMGENLGSPIGSSEFAFELISVAKRVEFKKGEK